MRPSLGPPLYPRSFAVKRPQGKVARLPSNKSDAHALTPHATRSSGDLGRRNPTEPPKPDGLGARPGRFPQEGHRDV